MAEQNNQKKRTVKTIFMKKSSKSIIKNRQLEAADNVPQTQWRGTFGYQYHSRKEGKTNF